MFHVQGTLCYCVGTLLPIESRIPSFVQLYIFGGDMEAQVSTQCSIMDGLDREIVATIQCVLSQMNPFVEMFLQAGEFIRNQELLNVQLAILEAQGVVWCRVIQCMLKYTICTCYCVTDMTVSRLKIFAL
jgi:hypothetical protein